MIKNYVTSILIILILINSIGCYSYFQINREDTDKIEKDDDVKITTLDEKVYFLTDLTIEGSEVKGLAVLSRSEQLRDIQAKEIVISINEIKRIEVYNFSKAVLTVVFIIAIPMAFIAIILGEASGTMTPLIGSN
jgi:hypothetical protein